MKTYSEFMFESIDCNKVSSRFAFSGSLQENLSAIDTIIKLLESDCESLIDLYCCIEEHIKKNFSKTGNMTRVNDKHKKQIMMHLSTVTNELLVKLATKQCMVPDCTKRI